jgi:hypothetical protein
MTMSSTFLFLVKLITITLGKSLLMNTFPCTLFVFFTLWGCANEA